MCWRRLVFAAALLAECEARVVPPRIYAPNPPECAEDVVGVMVAITDFAVGIITDGLVCVGAIHWHPHRHEVETVAGTAPLTVPDDFLVEQGLVAEEGDNSGKGWAPSWHAERLCAAGILTQIIAITSTIGDLMSLSFDCFGHNVGCGQAITRTATWFMQAASSLILATDICGNPDPMKAFTCYARIWHTIQRLMKASKYIDVCIDLCPNPDGSPKEEDDLPPNPLNPPIAHKVDGNDTASTTETPMGAWAGLQMILDPEIQEVTGAAVERRRLVAGPPDGLLNATTQQEMVTALERAKERLTALADPLWLDSLDEDERFDEESDVPQTWEEGQMMLEKLFGTTTAGGKQRQPIVHGFSVLV